jgi:hypothetical protein
MVPWRENAKETALVDSWATHAGRRNRTVLYPLHLSTRGGELNDG